MAAEHYSYLQLDVEEIEVENVKTLQNKLINVNFGHNRDSPSLDVVYTRNMQRNMWHMLDICCIYAPHISPNSHIFPHILPQDFRIF